MADDSFFAKRTLGVFKYSGRALELVWATSRRLTLCLAALTLVAGLIPAAIAYVGALIVDAVVAASRAQAAGATLDFEHVVWLVALEALLVASMAGIQRGLSLSQSLLRAQLGQRVNVMILEKALTLELTQFEDSEFYDKLTRARREASSRPLSLVMRTLGLLQNAVLLASFGALLVQFSPWAVLLLVLAGLPAFVVEARFSGEAFRLFRWRSPETRMQLYIETLLAREDHAKEVKLFGLGPLFLDRYRAIFRKLYAEDRKLAIRRDAWGFGLGLLATAALYGAYIWIARSTVVNMISLGQMTMYLMLFRQGQAAVSASLSAIGGMYDDNLYLSTLYEFLDTPVASRLAGKASGHSPDPQKASLDPQQSGASGQGPGSQASEASGHSLNPQKPSAAAHQLPEPGIRFENVCFAYPGAEEPALVDIDLTLRPGQSLALVGENGSGKTTLIKLLTGLYTPDRGRILLDGRDLRDWDADTLRRRIGVIFQDFARYQIKVGENIGVGDVRHFDDRKRWLEAADKGMADDFIRALPAGFDTQLGKWFNDGRELSGGQWQKIALSRAFMRSEADILVLDEPTAAMDAAAEANIFEHFRQLTRERIAILISHRFSTVRMADQIVVIERGRIVERGDHAALMALDGHYARLFSLQAAGYR